MQSAQAFELGLLHLRAADGAGSPVRSRLLEQEVGMIPVDFLPLELFFLTLLLTDT